MRKITFEKHVLPNGLTVIFHQDRSSPLVAVNIWHHVGSKDEEPPDIRGDDSPDRLRPIKLFVFRLT